MSRKTLNRRLEAIDRQITQEDPAERWGFSDPASVAVVAYHAGNLQPNGNPNKAFNKALNYSGAYEAYMDLIHNNNAGIKRRYEKAVRPVFEKFGYDYFPKEKWEEGITKLAGQLPPEWREWIQREEYESKRAVRDWAESCGITMHPAAMKDDLRKSRVFSQKHQHRTGACGAAGVDFIDENGGGPGVRLRKRPRTKPTK